MGESEATLKCSEPPSGTLQWQDRQTEHTRSSADSFLLLFFWNETQNKNSRGEHLPSCIIGQRPILSLVLIFRVASKENGSLTHPRPHLGKLPSLHQRHRQRSFLLASFLFKGSNAQRHTVGLFPQNVYSWSGGV